MWFFRRKLDLNKIPDEKRADFNSKSKNRRILEIYKAIYRRYNLPYTKLNLPLVRSKIEALSDDDIIALHEDIEHWSDMEKAGLQECINSSDDFEKLRRYIILTYPKRWTTQSNNPRVLDIYYQLVLNTLPGTSVRTYIEIASLKVDELTPEDIEDLKEDFEHWAYYRRDILRIVNQYKYRDLHFYFLKETYKKTWLTQTTNSSVIKLYKHIVENESSDSEYWEEGHGSTEVISLFNHFTEQDCENLKEDFENWSNDQIEIFVVAFVNYTFGEEHIGKTISFYDEDEEQSSTALKRTSVKKRLEVIFALCQQRLISIPTNYDVLEHIITFLYHYGFLLGRDKENYEKMKEISRYFQFEQWQSQISINPAVYDPVIVGFQDRMKQLQDYHSNTTH